MSPALPQERTAILGSVLGYSKPSDKDAAFAAALHRSADMLSSDWQSPLQSVFAY